MSIIRSKRADNFTVIGNHIFNSGLSFRAIGLLVFLLSRPDNWKVSVAHLVKMTDDTKNKLGKEAIRSVLAELVERGYIRTQEIRGEAGRYFGLDYIVYDEPQTASPETAKPSPANPPLINTDLLTNTDNKANVSKADACDESLLKAWNEFAEENGLAKLRGITDQKKKIAIQCYNHYKKVKQQIGQTVQITTLAEFAEAYLAAVNGLMTDFHRGASGWKASYDFIFAKQVMENVITTNELRRK